MNRSLVRLFGLIGVLALGASACTDAGSPLQAVSALDVQEGGPYLSLSPVRETVRVLERSVPLAEAVVVSRVIDSSGGVIEVPAAGLQLTIPAQALQRPTEITVRAHEGRLVAYSFEPHGTRFARVVTADQSLAGTNAEGASERVSGRGYFADPVGVSWDSDQAEVTELSLVRSGAGNGEVQFYLNHFSGYLIAID